MGELLPESRSYLLSKLNNKIAPMTWQKANLQHTATSDTHLYFAFLQVFWGSCEPSRPPSMTTWVDLLYQMIFLSPKWFHLKKSIFIKKEFCYLVEWLKIFYLL